MYCATRQVSIKQAKRCTICAFGVTASLTAGGSNQPSSANVKMETQTCSNVP